MSQYHIPAVFIGQPSAGSFRVDPAFPRLPGSLGGGQPSGGYTTLMYPSDNGTGGGGYTTLMYPSDAGSAR